MLSITRQISVLVAEFVGGAVAGGLFGAIGVFGGFFSCALIFGPFEPSSEPFDGFLLPVLVGFAVGGVGAVIGLGVGVYVVGKLFGGQGGFWLAVLGGMMGSVVGCSSQILLQVVLEGYDAPWPILIFPVVVIPPALATLIFNLGQLKASRGRN